MVSNSLLKSAKKISTRIINLSLVSIIGLSSLVVATPLLFSASASALSPSVNGYATIQEAIDNAGSGATITLSSGTYQLNSQIRIVNSVHIIGAGDSTIITVGNTAWANATGSKGYAPLITISAGNNAVTLENIKVTGASNIAMASCEGTISHCTDYGHGVNVVSSSNVTLNNVTSVSNQAAGLIVNGSNVTANNLITGNNGWHSSVNVDPGSGVITPSVFTLNSGNLGDAKQIWSDGSHVSVSAMVTVNAPGFRMYKVGGTIMGYFWSNRELTNAATITRSGATTWYAHIQNAINDAISGDTVSVGRGTYVENLVISKALTLSGAGQGLTIIEPAVSSPNPCTDTTLCGSSSAASNVILTQASNITIHDLTVEGDNPNLTSTIVRNGADVDARNGIVEDNTIGTQFNNLTIYNTTVRDIYRRGVYASSGGSDFNIHDNTVNNVEGDGSSIGMFASSATGVFAHNTVSLTYDAISANHSRGIQFLYNTISSSDSGIHTDNSGDGGIGNDLIQGNIITTGTTSSIDPTSYGIWDFVPYRQVTIDNNTINNVDYGVATFGQGAIVTTLVTNNHINLSNLAGSRGAFVTTDQLGNGTQNVSTSFIGNTISNAETGFYVESPGSKTATVTAHSNTITGFTTAYNNNSSTTQDAMNNYWGFTSPNFLSIIHGVVTHNPWYADAAMTIPATASALGGSTPTMTFGAVPPMAITTSSGIVKVDIPTGLTVTGPAGWDGIVSLPVPTSTFVITPDPGHTFTPIEAISIGAGDTHLTLDQPVKLDFVNQAGKQAGWSQAGVFHKITAVCDSATAPTLSLGADCKINVGADLIVWTKHFTAFVVYTDTTTAVTTTTTSATTTQNYVVIAGDTLSDIGIKFGVDWNLIANYNGIDAPYTIYPGQVLKLVTSNVVTPVVVTAPNEATSTPGKVLGDSISPQIGTAASTVASKPASTFKAKWYYLVVAVVLASITYFAYKRSKKSSKEV